MPRLLQALLALLLGLAAGLFYGLKISPVEYIDLAPNTLHADYRNDYLLMVAESYQNDKDIELAIQRLSQLGNIDPIEIIEESISIGGYTKEEILQLEELKGEIETWLPASAESAP